MNDGEFGQMGCAIVFWVIVGGFVWLYGRTTLQIVYGLYWCAAHNAGPRLENLWACVITTAQ